MERIEIMEKAMCIKKLSAKLMSAAGEEPFIRANAESIFAHARLLCNEFGLDIDENQKED